MRVWPHLADTPSQAMTTAARHCPAAVRSGARQVAGHDIDKKIQLTTT